jgi:glycine cleavage system H lipoate-binding protein
MDFADKIEDTIDDKDSKIPNDKMQIERDEYEFLMPLDPTTKLKPFVDRYFIKYFQTFEHPKFPLFACKQYAFLHTNKLFMIGLAKEHEILINNLNMYKISFDILTKGNALEVRGKKKKGGMRVKPGSPICEIFCENQVSFIVNALVDGSIIELNENIEKNPNLIKEYPESKGYIAIINSGTKVDHLLKKLIPEEAYRKSLIKPEAPLIV